MLKVERFTQFGWLLGATQQCLLSPSSCNKRDMILVWVIGVAHVLKIQDIVIFFILFSTKISKCGFITPENRNRQWVSLYDQFIHNA